MDKFDEFLHWTLMVLVVPLMLAIAFAIWSAK